MSRVHAQSHHPITSAVKRMYEAFPYPNYPLWLRLNWQEGHMSSSRFSGCLLEDTTGIEAAINARKGQYVRNGRTILVAGSGETLPYILRKWEPGDHRLLCVDLSAKSLQRARMRVGVSFKPTEFIRSDINDFLTQQAAVTGPYNHIDVYGVLHHLVNPQQTLRQLSTHLSERGTMRVMVYNQSARRWIHHLQKTFRLLKLDPFVAADRETARQILSLAGRLSPNLRESLNCLGEKTLRNNARLVDTFFHAREARLSVEHWLNLMDASGLKVMGLLDRYAELDDLPNPLWQAPTTDQLQVRARDGRFENNLELFLTRKPKAAATKARYGREAPPRWTSLLPALLKGPPRRWFDFNETRSVSLTHRWKLWNRHLMHTNSVEGDTTVDELASSYKLPTLQRLARQGAILPGQIKDAALKASLYEPMTTSMERPLRADRVEFANTEIKTLFKSILQQKQVFTEKRLELAIERLKRAQISNS